MFFVLFFLVNFQIVASAELMSNRITMVPDLKALAARTCYEKQKYCKEIAEVQELIDLYEPLTIHNVLDKLTKIKRINDFKLQKQYINFIQDHRVEICFEAKNPETGKLFSDFDSGDRVQSYRRGVKHLEVLVNIYNRAEADIKLPDNCDGQLIDYVITRRDLPVIGYAFVAAGVLGVLLFSSHFWIETNYNQ